MFLNSFDISISMDKKEKKILHLRLGLALLKIIEERKEMAKVNKANGTKDHKLVSSIRKLAAASAIDFATIQKITKRDQGLELFTFIDIIEALDLNMVTFGEYFNSITDQEIKDYQASIQKSRKETSKKSKK